MIENIEAYPLHWPPGWPRTAPGDRQGAQFSFGRGGGYNRQRGASMAVARDNLLAELNRMGCDDWNLILSTNVALRRDGLPCANQKEPEDPGVAIYFKINGEDKCFPCDRWDRVADNIHAIGLSIAALRGLDRWGAKHMVEAAFRGFKALPAGPQWWQTLGLPNDQANVDEIKRAFKRRAQSAHPDQGGDHEQMITLQEAYETGLELRV